MFKQKKSGGARINSGAKKKAPTCVISFRVKNETAQEFKTYVNKILQKDKYFVN